MKEIISATIKLTKIKGFVQEQPPKQNFPLFNIESWRNFNLTILFSCDIFQTFLIYVTCVVFVYILILHVIM